MSTSGVGVREEERAPGFWGSTNGKKAVMAVTGAILFIFVIGHLAGNLQVFEGPAKLNAYGKLLHTLGELLWPVRIVLLLCVTLHIMATVQLALLKKRARPAGYIHPGAAFIEGDVYHNVVAGFQVWWVSVWYIFSMILLGLHLRHGIWS